MHLFILYNDLSNFVLITPKLKFIVKMYFRPAVIIRIIFLSVYKRHLIIIKLKQLMQNKNS